MLILLVPRVKSKNEKTFIFIIKQFPYRRLEVARRIVNPAVKFCLPSVRSPLFLSALLLPPVKSVDASELVADFGEGATCLLGILLRLDGVGVDVQDRPNNVLSEVGHSVGRHRRFFELRSILRSSVWIGCVEFVLMSKSNLS